jgi:hypothetical protein
VGCLSPYSTPPPQLTLCCYLNYCLLPTVLCQILHPDIGLICDYVSAKAQVDCLQHPERSMHDNPTIAADGVICISIRLRRNLEHLCGQKGATLMDPFIRSTIKTTYLLWGSLSLAETATELPFDHDTYFHYLPWYLLNICTMNYLPLVSYLTEEKQNTMRLSYSVVHRAIHLASTISMWTAQSPGTWEHGPPRASAGPPRPDERP